VYPYREGKGVSGDRFFIESSNMADLWYYAWGTKRFGPFSAGQLRELVALGRLQPTDTVWKEGVEKGALAAKVSNLFPDLQAQARPVHATVPIATKLLPSAHPSQGITPSIPNSVAQLQPAAPSPNDQGTPEDPQDTITLDGPMLTGMVDENKSAVSLFPTAINSPALADIETRKLKPPPSLPRATEVKPKGPAITNHNQASPQQRSIRTKRAIGGKGAVIIRQDGELVHFRKKCAKCGYEDSCTRAIPIRNGVTRDHFFCPKCKKNGEVVIQGIA
jgi:hypothetical protein